MNEIFFLVFFIFLNSIILVSYKSISQIINIYDFPDKRKIHKEEKEIVLWARESVVSLKNISVGELLSKKNISVKRPSPGKNNIPAKDLDRVIGKKAKKFIKKNSQLL